MYSHKTMIILLSTITLNCEQFSNTEHRTWGRDLAHERAYTAFCKAAITLPELKLFHILGASCNALLKKKFRLQIATNFSCNHGCRQNFLLWSANQCCISSEKGHALVRDEGGECSFCTPLPTPMPLIMPGRNQCWKNKAGSEQISSHCTHHSTVWQEHSSGVQLFSRQWSCPKVDEML